MRIELMACESVLLSEIGCKECKRADVAMTYAMSLCSSEARGGIDWAKVNAAIVARWSPAALTWIKERAWKILAEKSAAAGATTAASADKEG